MPRNTLRQHPSPTGGFTLEGKRLGAGENDNGPFPPHGGEPIPTSGALANMDETASLTAIGAMTNAAQLVAIMGSDPRTTVVQAAKARLKTLGLSP